MQMKCPAAQLHSPLCPPLVPATCSSCNRADDLESFTLGPPAAKVSQLNLSALASN